MPWGAVAGAVVGGVVNSALADDKGGGAGSSTASKEPWADAAPWLRDNIKAGQNLQGQYTATPFNAQQLAAYGNMGRQTNYVNNLVPDLLGQISNQSSGFDRSNTNGRVKPYTFNGTGMGAAGGAQSGLLGQLTNPNTVSQYTSAANPPPAAPPAPAAPAPTGQFEAFDPTKMDLANYARASIGMRSGKNGADLGYNGGFGSFRYGDAAPQLGTQQYYDYQQFLQGGGDPLGLYSGPGSSGGL